ncbi:heparan sulfate 2-O-sulfotransferase pipe-like [Neocloeon triangulifer]|uniref:heparan sulfate 2-O-sulfotransferase pipe-like n=1 Tax=Neocloeon triangulifer TaxID=2078957 RepID=UPI00286EBE47|nr:heparan sulfate 2-O-sulfotransferase pipe-like [Neocloeon triangulifer]
MQVRGWDFLRANKRPLIFLFLLTKFMFILFCVLSLKTLDSINRFDWDATRRIDSEPSALNRTPNHPLMLIYNRIPRSGGTTLKSLLTELGHIRGFIHRSSKELDYRQLTYEEEKMFVHDLMSEKKLFFFPFSFDRTIYYINFTRFRVYRPAYINFLRDPAARAASLFYSQQMSNQLLADPDSRVMLKDSVQDVFGECVLHGLPECKFQDGQSYETAVAYFCGSDPECLILNSRAALQRAKRVLETEYSVVGILELMKESLKVMEAYVPKYLTGILALYKHQDVTEKVKKSLPHPEPSLRALKVLKRQFRSDYELYEFALQRLMLQLKSVQGNSTLK